MALSKELEELLAVLPDDDRDTSRKLLEKHQVLRDGYLRQADYDRFMNKTKAEREAEQERLQKAQEFATQWDDWQKENVPKHDALLESYSTLEKERDDLLAKVSAAATATGEDVDQVKLLQLVEAEFAKKGYLSKAEAEKIIHTEAQKLAAEEAKKIAEQERQSFWKETYPTQIRFNTTLTNLQLKHSKEFEGQFLDTDALFKYMAENKQDDPTKAYDQMVAPDRQKREVERLVTERLTEERKSNPLPGTNAPPTPELGPLQLFRMKKGPDVPEDAEPGDGRLSSVAAQELRAEGKF